MARATARPRRITVGKNHRPGRPELKVPEAKVAIATNGGAGALFDDEMLLGLEQP